MPIEVWFSSTLKVLLDEKTGPSGSTSIIFTCISWSVEISPSEAVIFAEKEARVSKSGEGLKVKSPEEDAILITGKLFELETTSAPIPEWILQ